MPLPADKKVVETSKALLETLHAISGPHPGFRPVHAKGLLIKGTFTPTQKASRLSKAHHFNAPSTPIIARFSSASGIPSLPDTDPSTNPRGLAIRFVLAEHPRRVHTDIIAVSVNAFPASNGEEALGFFSAVKDGTVQEYVKTNPKAIPFLQAPRPFPAGLDREKYYSLHAFKLITDDGTVTFVRYRIVPEAGVEHISDEEAKTKPPGYLFDGLTEEVKTAGPVGFKLVAQVAEEGDVTDDTTQHWPEEREVVELGTVKLESVAEEQNETQKNIIFDPMPRVEGVEPSADPLLQTRDALYLLSGRERRAA